MKRYEIEFWYCNTVQTAVFNCDSKYEAIDQFYLEFGAEADISMITTIPTVNG